jgi:hypothetical protein
MLADVSFGSKADICSAKAHVRFTPESGRMGATGDVRFGPKADVELEMSAGTISIENSSAWAKLFLRDNGKPRSKNALPRRNASWEWRR